ncbi:hypothetical protein R1flu_024470 [Riccia fluitans]|uniref:Uncharacterized protein n=1 Tax=Riccia fluitans TaxID=41844 RepID=A0ABD1XZ34_9MARC
MSVKKLTYESMGAFITRFKAYQTQIGKEIDDLVMLKYFIHSLYGFIGYGTINVVRPTSLEDTYEMAMWMEGTYEPHMLQLDVWKTFGPKGVQVHNMPPIPTGPSQYVLSAPFILAPINQYGASQVLILPALGYGILVSPTPIPILQLPTQVQYQNPTNPTIQRLIAQIEALQVPRQE